MGDGHFSFKDTITCTHEHTERVINYGNNILQ